MIRASVQRLFDWKIRGIRWIEIVGFVCVGAMVFSVYVAKAAAARESAEIGSLERQIAENTQRVRLLRAEAARLEQPGRLEVLSRGAGLEPISAKHQTQLAQLPELQPRPEPKPVTLPEPIADAPAAAPVEEVVR